MGDAVSCGFQLDSFGTFVREHAHSMSMDTNESLLEQRLGSQCRYSHVTSTCKTMVKELIQS